jgi:predicted RNA binding protein YcfA (HicA-like mRNA interferase family)
MPKLPGINHRDAIRAFQKAGFSVSRQGKHVIMNSRDRRIVIPRGNPINAFTMGGIIRDAGLTIDQFKALL